MKPCSGSRACSARSGCRSRRRKPASRNALGSARTGVLSFGPSPDRAVAALLEARQPQPFPALARGSNGTTFPLGGRLLANRAASASSSSQAFSRQRGPKSRCSAKIIPVGRPKLTGWRRLSSIDAAAPGGAFTPRTCGEHRVAFVLRVLGVTVWESLELQGISWHAPPGPLQHDLNSTNPSKPLISWGNPLEASPGIEPGCKDLQSSA